MTLNHSILTVLESLKTREELDEVYRVLKRKSSEITLKVAASFNIGDSVSFEGNRNTFYKRQYGHIQKISAKTITVKVNDGLVWKVGPTLLRMESKV